MNRFLAMLLIMITPVATAQETWGPAEFIDSENWWNLDCGGDLGYGFFLPSISSNDSLLFMQFWCFDTAGVAYMHYEDGQWRDLSTLPPEIQNLNPGSPFFADQSDTVLYFTSDNDEAGYGLSDLWAAGFSDGGWSEPWNLGPVINTEARESSASMSDLGDRLYFIRDGIIMFSDIINGEFSEPVELPDHINSALGEFDARISREGERLYFTRGSIDPRVPVLMMVSRLSEGSWDEPVPLNSNINFASGDCEFMPDLSCAPSFSLNGTKMYFSHFEHLQPWCEPNYRIAVSFLETDIEPKDQVLPHNFYISAFPNPFNSRSVIRLEGDVSGIEHISIYDVAGRLIRRWPVNNQILWDGTDFSGATVSSGIYFVTAANAKTRILKKMTLLK